MNTRGLMELIVLNIGLDLGVISPTLFAMMVIMALVTTVAASPALVWLTCRGRARRARRLGFRPRSATRHARPRLVGERDAADSDRRRREARGRHRERCEGWTPRSSPSSRS